MTSQVKGMCNNHKAVYGPSVSLYDSLAINKLNGRGLSNTACRERLPKKTKVTWKDYQAAPVSRSVSIIKVSGQMCSDKFKRGLGFHFTIIILA